jgi:acyl carrier protein
MDHKLLEIINVVRKNKGVDPVFGLNEDTDLRTDLGFDSLDLAELTVRIERETGVDIFADGFVRTVSDIQQKLK